MRLWNTLIGIGLLAAGCGDDDSIEPRPDDPFVVCEVALPTFMHETEPGAGPSDLGTADSDGNGIADRDEWGTTAHLALDSDGDLTPDFQDVDDDADGLRDVHDADRLAPEREADVLDVDHPFIFRSQVDEGGTTVLYDTARVGDTLTVFGRGFTCASTVAFVGGREPLNVPVAAANSVSFRVVVPDGARGPMEVHESGLRSAPLRVHVAHTGEPLLRELDDPTAIVRQTLTLEGSGLAGTTEVMINGTSATPVSATDTEVSVMVPDRVGGPADDVRVKVGDVVSNAVFVRLVREVPVDLELPAELPIDRSSVFVVDHLLRAEPLDGSGSATVLGRVRTLDVVTTLYRPEGANGAGYPLWSGVLLPSDSRVVLSPTSEATAIAMLGAGADRQVAEVSLTELRDRVQADPAVTALAAELLAAVGDAPRQRDRTAAYRASMIEAIDAAGSIIGAGLESGEFVPRDFSASVVPAVITPMEDFVYFQVTQTADTGNITFANDTMTFMSVKIEGTEERRVLQDHVTGMFHGSMVGSQSSLLSGFRANSVEFPEPRSRDAHVEVVTPGLMAPLPSDARAARARELLALRTAIEQVLLPLLEKLLGSLFDGGLVADIFLAHAPDTVLRFMDAYRGGNVKGAMAVLIDFVQSQALGVLEGEAEAGPILREILRAAWKKAPESAFKQFFETIVARNPWVKLVWEAVDGFVTYVDVKAALDEISDMSAVYELDVLFGLGISHVGLGSAPLVRECDSRVMAIYGTGFTPLDDGTLPVVRVNDLDARGPETLDTSMTSDAMLEFAPADPRTGLQRLFLVLSEHFVAQIRGPLSVEVSHDGEMARAPEDLMVTGGLFEIESITPPSALAGQPITITGLGFDTAAGLEVHLVDAVAPTSRWVITTFDALTPGSITFDVPSDVPEDTSLLVHLERGRSDLCVMRTTELPFRTGVTSIAAGTIVAGQNFSCARRSAVGPGGLACWGDGAFGQLGNGGTVRSPTAVTVMGIADAVEIAETDGRTICARRATGQVLCWGTNDFGQLGDGVATHTDCAGTDCALTPVMVSMLSDASHLAGGLLHQCATRIGGQAVCWGINSDGQLGNGTTVDSSVPVAVMGIADAITIEAGEGSSCAVRAGGQAVCWGDNSMGQLGNGTTGGSSLVPAAVVGVSDAVALSMGGAGSCAIRAGSGQVVCWGRGSGVATDLPGLVSATDVSVGANHGCARLSSGEAWCWGENNVGQLGDGTRTASASPVRVLDVTGVLDVSAGENHTCAHASLGGHVCWGGNARGQVGNGTTSVLVLTPTAVVGL